MYIALPNVKRAHTYYRGSEQASSMGAYLILGSSAEERDSNGFETLFGAVRMVALRQCGQFMMGNARIAGETITVSGSFGSDGLPINLDRLSVREQWRDQWERERYHRDLDPADPRAVRLRSKFVKVSEELAARYWRDPNDGWQFGDYRGINAIGQAIATEIN